MEGVNLTIILVSLLILFSSMDFKHKIIQWNCRGLKPNFNEVSLLISEYNPSVFCFQETFLKPDDNISLKGFNIYNYVHTDCLRPSGGASVFVKSSFPQRKIDLQTELPWSDSTTLPWSLGHTSHLGTILIVILVPIWECQEWSPICSPWVAFSVTRRGWPGRLRACRIWAYKILYDSTRLFGLFDGVDPRGNTARCF